MGNLKNLTTSATSGVVETVKIVENSAMLVNAYIETEVAIVKATADMDITIGILEREIEQQELLKKLEAQKASS